MSFGDFYDGERMCYRTHLCNLHLDQCVNDVFRIPVTQI